MRRTCVLLCPLVVLAAGCQSGRVGVSTYWGTTTERPPVGSSYDWWHRSNSSQSLSDRPDERAQQFIRQTVEAELEAVGFRKRSAHEQPDLLVSMRLGRGFQPSPRGPEDRGTLAIEVFEAASGRLIYLGSADAVVDPTLTPEERTARLQRAVHEILKPLRAK